MQCVTTTSVYDKQTSSVCSQPQPSVRPLPLLGGPRLSKGMDTHTENQSYSPWINTPSRGTHRHLLPFLFHSMFRCTTTILLIRAQASHRHTPHHSKTHSHRWAGKMNVSNSLSQTLFHLHCFITQQYKSFFFHSWIWPPQTFEVKQFKELIKTYLCYFSQSHIAQCTLNLGDVGA